MKKLLTLLVLTVAVAGTAAAQHSCDTLFNLANPLDTPFIISVDTGFLAGNNMYGDMIKAEGFAAVPGYNDTIESAILYFGYATVNTTDSLDSIKVYVWDNTGTSIQGFTGAPGNVIDSAYLTLGNIAQAAALNDGGTSFVGNQVFFSGRTLIATDTFYVGVVLPTKTGDTVALYTNSGEFNTDGDGWEFEYNFITGSGTGWGSYIDDYNDYGFGQGNFILASICGSPVPDTSTNGIIALSNNQQVKVYPNPATDVINLVWSQQTNADLAIIDMKGNVLSTMTVSGGMETVYDIHNLATGAYILRITDKATNQQESTLITKF